MWLEPKVSLTRGERNSLESGGLSHTILCDECFSATYLSLFENGKNDEFFLVGRNHKERK